MKKLSLLIMVIFSIGQLQAENSYTVEQFNNFCLKEYEEFSDSSCTEANFPFSNPNDSNMRWKYDGADASKQATGIFRVNDDGSKELVANWEDNNTLNADRSFFDVKSGKFYIYTNDNYTIFDPEDNSLEASTKGYVTSSGLLFKDIGIDGMIEEKPDGSIHIGENSLVTIEENGVQQLYATDATDEMININIKKGTDLLIDGVSVSGSLNTNATNIATNTTDIATNKTSIATNTTDIATNKTSIATNTTDIATNKTSIATNTTDIATNKTSIATNVTNIAANTAEIATYTDSITSNTTAVAALGSDLSTFKASTNSQMNYMKSDYSSGIASAVAMSQFNLAQEGFSVGIGRGSYNDEDETAFGLGYGGEFKNGTLFKLQASKSGDASGVGLTISF